MACVKPDWAAPRRAAEAFEAKGPGLVPDIGITQGPPTPGLQPFRSPCHLTARAPGDRIQSKARGPASVAVPTGALLNVGPWSPAPSISPGFYPTTDPSSSKPEISPSHDRWRVLVSSVKIFEVLTIVPMIAEDHGPDAPSPSHGGARPLDRIRIHFSFSK